MNILYVLDRNYAPQVCASMASACENNQDLDELVFYVLGLGLDAQTKENIEATGGGYGRPVHTIDVDGFMDDFEGVDTFGWNEVVMARLLLDRYVPSSLDSVLYLDGDTIVRGSIARLQTPVTGPNMVMGAVIEPTVDRRRLAALGLEGEPYFNSGVLAIDLVRWRSSHAEERLLAYCKAHADHLVAPDQDALNGALLGQIEPLPPTFNYCNTYEFYPYRTLAKLMEGLPFYGEDEVAQAIEDPVIVHYLGEERPWRAGNTHTYADEYRRYLGLTPYADTPEEEGWRTYFRAWRLFNGAMRPVPMLRYRIITMLVPHVLEWRSRQRKR